MLARPQWWRSYFVSDDHVGRLFSLSDRVRYYWPEADVAEAVQRLLAELTTIPATLVSQYLPEQYAAWRAGEIGLTADALIAHRVGAVLARYDAACG